MQETLFVFLPEEERKRKRETKRRKKKRKREKRKLGENILISNSTIDHFFFAAEIYIQISWNDDIRF